MATHQRTHHVDEPRHLLFEDLLRNQVLLSKPGSFLKMLHDVLSSVLVPTSTQVGQHFQLFRPKNLILQGVVPVVGGVGIRRGFGHEEPRLHVGHGDLLDEAFQGFRRLFLKQNHRAYHGSPEAQEVVLGVGHDLPSAQAIHGEAIDLLNPSLELLIGTELIQLVSCVDLPQQAAQLVVAAMILQTHLGRQDRRGSLHHARQQLGSILFLLEE
mmetsp:Transcript_39701/g.85877  ORF Transcript_39701/g.85877 Transcript_39701/m.85877 type:complete len:213 (+) Transcript_39701:1841-2479(+)